MPTARGRGADRYKGEWKPTDLARALDALRAHMRDCPICRTWRPDHVRNPCCNPLREHANTVIHIWSSVPAGSRPRQLALFADFQEGEPDDKPPY